MTYAERKATAIDAGRCAYPGCVHPPGDTDLCQGHNDDAKRRKRETWRRNRALRRSRKLCMRCGKKRKPGSKWCAACLIRQDRVKTTELDKQLDKRDRLKDRTVGIAERDGYVRARYVGQPRTGPQSKVQLDEQDLTDAVARLNRAKAGLAYAASPEVAQLPRIQRLEATKAALSQAYHGVRFVIEVLDRHGEDVTQLVVRPKDDED